MQFFGGSFEVVLVSAAEVSAYVAIFLFLVTVIGGVVTYFIRRRGTTGTTSTSDAAVLWKQAQDMRAELQAQVDKLTEQRDKLIESQAGQVIPVLTMVIDSLKQITASLARLEVGRNGK
jgi:hypothetical protein